MQHGDPRSPLYQIRCTVTLIIFHPLLQARLVVVAQEQQLAEVAEIRGDMVKAEWGQQIRNYVFHPYKLVRHWGVGRSA